MKNKITKIVECLPIVKSVEEANCDDVFFLELSSKTEPFEGIVLLDISEIENDMIFLVCETDSWEIPYKNIPLKSFLAFVLANEQNHEIVHSDNDYGQGCWIYDIGPSNIDQIAIGKFRYVAKITIPEQLCNSFIKTISATLESLLSSFNVMNDFALNNNPSVDDATLTNNIQITFDPSLIQLLRRRKSDPLLELEQKLKDLGIENSFGEEL